MNVLLLCFLFALPKHIDFHSSIVGEFEILADNKKTSEYLAENIHIIKRLIFERWGLKDIPLPKKCLVVCLSNKETYTEIFNLNESVFKFNEQHRGENVSVIWTYIPGNWRESSFPEVFTQVCLREYGVVEHVDFPEWMINGISILNGKESDIKERLVESYNILRSYKYYNAEDILNGKISNSHEFNNQSMMMCLFWIKEFPKKNILTFCDKNGNNVQELGFASYDNLNYQFERYMFNLSYDAKVGRVPTYYFSNLSGKRQ